MEFFNQAIDILKILVMALALVWRYGASSTFWKVTARITRAPMLMYGREAQDMDSQPCHYSEVRGTQ